MPEKTLLSKTLDELKQEHPNAEILTIRVDAESTPASRLQPSRLTGERVITLRIYDPDMDQRK